MTVRSLVRMVLGGLALVPALGQAADLCAGKTPGTFTFYAQEISRDKPLPPAVTQLQFGQPMFALACLTDSVGPQPDGGKQFRVVLYVNGKQFGAVFRPQLSVARKDVIIAIDEDFGDSMKHMLDAGTHTFRLQAASEKPTGKIDVTLDLKNEVAYVQQLRQAGYLADGRVQVRK
ncbi:MAG TPA: hypothetical protein PLW86_19260 [Rhodocyclaceae bacterium]|nr:hypothetical protein [Rhodocyclaceae bacterium]